MSLMEAVAANESVADEKEVPVSGKDTAAEHTAAVIEAKRAPSSDSQDSGVGQEEVKEESKAEDSAARAASLKGQHACYWPY